ncbi:MAG: hypothetical protein LH645_13425 [Actinomycetia bacterium]|nr:hypothetical protein [Actinomycetes bacterium]
MNSVESLMRGYLDACTPVEVELRELADAAAPVTRHRPRRPASLIPMVASVAVAVLLIGGVVLAREQLDNSDGVALPANGVSFDGSVPLDLMGTWVVLSQPSDNPADLQRQVRITLLPDGSWSGWDRCDTVGGCVPHQRRGARAL